MVFGFTACGDDSGNSGSGSVGGDGNGGETPEKPYIPTATEIVSARKSSASQTVQGYDFNLTFTGNFNVLGLGTALNGKYDGSYRYNGDSGDLSFKRTTGGALLFDSTCYVFNSGDNRIKVTMDGSEVKKLSVELPEEQNITMINLPVVAIVDSITESNISNVIRAENSEYEYSCQVAVNGSNPVYAALGKVFEKLGTGVSFKGIEMAGNASTLDFNLKNGKLDDFHLGFQLQIGVKSVNVILDVDYSQKGAATSVLLPDTENSGIIYRTADIQTEVNRINAAIEDLKNDPVYSLDLTAKNEFDPGWNKLAIVDSYGARMYKKNADGVDWFNHSYYFKSHSETSGKETYKYTIGNVNGKDEDNKGTWLISRKSTNTQTKLDNISASTQFDFLTSMVKQRANEIDCITKNSVGNMCVYTVFLGKVAAKSVQEKIVGMINTNDYGDVSDVNNYFNTENTIKDASVEIVLTDGKISSIVCGTELCYTPTGGEYTEYNITLNNVIELQVNKNLAKAQEYIVPDKVKGNILGWGKNLNDSEYYIL